MKKGPKYIKIVINPNERGKSKKCLICGQSFGLSYTEHQCKRCNRAVCDKCSPTKAQTLNNGEISKKPHRLCNICKEESDALKKFLNQHKIVFMEDTYSLDWLKAFGYTKDNANHEYDEVTREYHGKKNQEEYNKMKSELVQVFQEIIHYKNYSLNEFFYLVIKDFDTSLIIDSLSRVLGTFLLVYPEVGYISDQVFLTLFLLCFGSESSAYSLLTLFYSKIIPQYAYPINIRNEKYEFFTEIDKTIQVLTQAFKMSSQDVPNMKTFLKQKLNRYIQSFTLNFFLFETSFFILNQLFIQPKTAYDDLSKYLASAFHPYLQIIKQQQYDEIELLLLRNIRTSILQEGYFSTKCVDFSKVITPSHRKSAITTRVKSVIAEDDLEKQLLRAQIEQLQSEITNQKKIITEQNIKIQESNSIIDSLQLKLNQSLQNKQLNGKDSVNDMESFLTQQDDEFLNLRRATQQKSDSEISSLQAYIQKLEKQIFIEYKQNLQLTDLLEKYNQEKSKSLNQESDEISLLDKNLQQYDNSYKQVQNGFGRHKDDGNQQQILTLEAKLASKDRTIQELELQLNKNKFEYAAKLFQLESTNQQLEAKCKEYAKQIQDQDNKQYKKFDDSSFVQQLQKKILDIQSEQNQQLKSQQEKYNSQISTLNQQLQKEQQNKHNVESQLNDSNKKINVLEKQIIQIEKGTNSQQSIELDIQYNQQNNDKELQKVKQQLEKIQKDYEALKSKHYEHLQFMLSIEKNKPVNQDYQLNLIVQKELEIKLLNEKYIKKKEKIRKLKQQERAWMRDNQDNLVKITSEDDTKQIGELISKIVILLNCENQISTSVINSQTLSLLIQIINSHIEIQNKYCDELSNIFDDNQLVVKLQELAEEATDSYVFDIISLGSTIEKLGNIFSRINSVKQKIIQLIKQIFGSTVDINYNHNIDVLILNLQAKLQQFQVEKDDLTHKLENLQLQEQKYKDLVEQSKQEKRVLQNLRDVMIDIPVLSQQEIFSFTESKLKQKEIDQEDAVFILEVRNKQIKTLKLLLLEKQNQLELFNNALIQLRETISNYFIQIMK